MAAHWGTGNSGSEAEPGEDDHVPGCLRGGGSWHGGGGRAPQKCRRFFIWKCEIMG